MEEPQSKLQEDQTPSFAYSFWQTLERSMSDRKNVDDDQCWTMRTIEQLPTGDQRHHLTESSGRWDASGDIMDAFFQEREKAFKWASELSPKKLHWCITIMASDTNAFTLYERKALLEVVALKLGKEIRGDS